LHTGNSGQHYLSYNKNTQWTATDPAQAVRANLYDLMPEGADAGFWRRLMTEIQMQLAISQTASNDYNAWWLWSNGCLQSPVNQLDFHLLGNSLLLEGIAKYLHKELAGSLDSNFEKSHNIMIHTNFNNVLSVSEKKDELAELQQKSLKQLFPALQKGRIQSVNIQTDDACWQLGRKDSWKFWLN